MDLLCPYCDFRGETEADLMKHMESHPTRQLSVTSAGGLTSDIQYHSHIVVGGIVCVNARFLTWPAGIIKIDGDVITVTKFGKKETVKTFTKDKVEKFDMGKRNSESSEMRTAYKKAKMLFDSSS